MFCLNQPTFLALCTVASPSPEMGIIITFKGLAAETVSRRGKREWSEWPEQKMSYNVKSLPDRGVSHQGAVEKGGHCTHVYPQLVHCVCHSLRGDMATDDKEGLTP